MLALVSHIKSDPSVNQVRAEFANAFPCTVSQEDGRLLMFWPQLLKSAYPKIISMKKANRTRNMCTQLIQRAIEG